MDLCAEMLLHSLHVDHADRVRAECICPAFRRRTVRLPLLGRRRWAFNADRLLNRHWDYPRYLGRRKELFDAFYLCDHSYAQLVHVLPAERTGVLCHDLDAFRCLLEPQAERRPRWFRWMMRRVLAGFQRAAVVFYTTAAVRNEILHHGLFDPARLVQVPLGVSREFHPEPAPDPETDSLLAPFGDAPFLLHVGSCIPRKRIDVLLQAFAAARAKVPGLKLVKVGGPWSPDQAALLQRLGLTSDVAQDWGISRRTIAALYRRAALVLLPSEAEGFGLPVIEGLACGAAMVASDLPVLREVGGDAIIYCPVGDVPAWTDTIAHLLTNPKQAPPLAARLARADLFSWSAHAKTILNAYWHLYQSNRATDASAARGLAEQAP